MSNSNRKILILGLDGATWDILQPLIDQDYLPNLAALLRNGTHGSLYSSIPPLTAPAWTSFQTGVNPGKHGVFDFRVYDRKQRKVWLVSSSDIQLPTLWQIAGAAGRRVIAINVPMTYPPQPVNGIVLGGMLAQNEDETLIYPAEKASDILARHPEYKISPPVVSQRRQMGRSNYVDANILVERNRCNLALDLMKTESWDIFMLQNQSLDYIQHAYFHLMDRRAAEFDEAGFLDVVRFYQSMDENIGRMVEAAPAGTDFLILSDHGFKLQHRLIHLNPWLRQHGYLVEQIDMRQRFLQLLRRADVLKLRRHLAHRVLRTKQARFGAAAASSFSRIDWSATRAYTVIGSIFGCVYLNRELVSDPSGLLDEIAEELCSLRDPQTGSPVVARVLPGKEIYNGPFAENGPDLLVEPAADYAFAAPALIVHPNPFTDIDFDLEIPGGHHPKGMFIWSGGGVKNQASTDSNLIDMAPTILSRLGIPVPTHMDGRVLKDLFSTPLETVYRDWKEPQPGAKLTDPPAGKDESDDRSLEERLRDLGYL